MSTELDPSRSRCLLDATHGGVRVIVIMETGDGGTPSAPAFLVAASKLRELSIRMTRAVECATAKGRPS